MTVELRRSEEKDDALRMFETDAYMVVGCHTKMEGIAKYMKGCTFRFVGTVDDKAWRKFSQFC